MNKLAAMRTFVAIVDRGSLTAAAEELGRSQPAVVRTLAALESHLGTRLLQRTTRRMSLTPEGRNYLERCRHILADVAAAEGAVQQDGNEPSGELRITAPVQFGQLHIAPAIAGFLGTYTKVRVDLLLLDRNIDLVEEGIDLALRIGRLADSSMIATRVGEVRRVVCASPALLAQTGVPKDASSMSNLPCIRQQNISHGTAWQFRRGSRNTLIKIDGPFGCNQIGSAVAACAKGVGFGQFLSYQVQEHVRQGDLSIVLEDFEVEPLPVNLVHPSGRLVSVRLRALIDWLKSELQKEQPFG